MLVFLSILAAGVLLFWTIVLLHKMQLRQKLDSVDRTIPLPPLDLKHKKRVLALTDSTEIALRGAQSNESCRNRYLMEILACDNGDCPALPDWQARTKFHETRNDYARALMNCARAFPLSVGLQPSCVARSASFAVRENLGRATSKCCIESRCGQTCCTENGMAICRPLLHNSSRWTCCSLTISISITISSDTRNWGFFERLTGNYLQSTGANH